MSYDMDDKLPPTQISGATHEVVCCKCGDKKVFKYINNLPHCRSCVHNPRIREKIKVKREPFTAPLKIGRNEPCWCGSGKKFKNCHINQV